jgi:hypothetical protein
MNGQFEATHGHSRGGIRSPTYRSWECMKQRCTNPNDPYFVIYGGKGVSVCEQWIASFETFLADMGERPEGLTLERKDRDGDYEPGNCVWATRRVQTLNRSNTVWVTLGGRTQCLSDWCREQGISHQLAKWRHRAGWSWDRALTTPAKAGKSWGALKEMKL